MTHVPHDLTTACPDDDAFIHGLKTGVYALAGVDRTIPPVMRYDHDLGVLLAGLAEAVA